MRTLRLTYRYFKESGPLHTTIFFVALATVLITAWRHWSAWIALLYPLAELTLLSVCFISARARLKSVMLLVSVKRGWVDGPTSTAKTLMGGEFFKYRRWYGKREPM